MRFQMKHENAAVFICLSNFSFPEAIHDGETFLVKMLKKDLRPLEFRDGVTGISSFYQLLIILARNLMGDTRVFE